MDIADATTDSATPKVPIVPEATIVTDTPGNATLPVDTVLPSAAFKEPHHSSHHSLSNDALEPSPAEAIPQHERQSPSSPTPVVDAELEPQPAPVSAPENEDQAPPPSSPISSQQPPLDDTPPPAPNTQATSDAVTANVHSKPSTTIPATPRLFTFDGPSGFLTSSIIDYWETIQGGQGWVDMIKTYLQLEQQPIPPGVRILVLPPTDLTLILLQCPLRLPTESRPTELSIWVKGRSLSPDRMPFITDTAAYGEGWIAWWIACQPAWRQGKGWPLPKERGDNVKWGKLGARGQNGMFLVVMSTTWWAASLKPTDDRGTFDGAMDDIRWVILQILEPLPATDAQRATQDPTPPPASQKPVSTAATWQTRTDGKRRSKPSRKLLEALN